MRRRPFLVSAVLLVATLGGAPPSGATQIPPPVHVGVSDFLFDPTMVTAGAGQTVVFDFVGPSHHTVTDASGMALYGSGSAGPGDPSFEVTYPAAGGYLFTCIPHPWMGGRVTVPMRMHRVADVPAPTFRLGWAATDAAAGFVYDVQIARPGRDWTDWLYGVTARTTTFTPTAGAGIYRVRARMRSLGGGHALWSPVATFHAG